MIGGNKNPSDFTISIIGHSPSPRSFAGSSSGTTVTLKAGSVRFLSRLYLDILLHTPPGCSGTIGGGQTIKCNIRNAITPPGKITVVKNVINDDRGTKKPSDFTIFITGNSPSPNNFHGSTTGMSISIQPGNYKVFEAAISGYATLFLWLFWQYHSR